MTTATPVVVVAALQFQPGSEEEALSVLEGAVKTAHGEDGCIKYALHRDNADPLRFYFIEKWASQEALDTHMGTPAFAELGGKLGPILAGAPEINVTTAVPFGDGDRGAI